MAMGSRSHERVLTPYTTTSELSTLPMFEGKVRHVVPPRPHSGTLDLLEKSLIHAKAEEQHEAHCLRIDELAKSPAGWANVNRTFDADFDRISKELQQQLQSGQPIGSKGGYGIVCCIVYRDVPLAKKSILTHTKADLNRIKSEVAIGKKLDDIGIFSTLSAHISQLRTGTTF